MPTKERNKCKRCTIGIDRMECFDCMRQALAEDRVRADGRGKWWVIDRPAKDEKEAGCAGTIPKAAERAAAAERRE
jgi:hypothetical protein